MLSLKEKGKKVKKKLAEKKDLYKKYLEKYKILDNYGSLQLAKYEREHPLEFYKWLEAKKKESEIRKKNEKDIRRKI